MNNSNQITVFGTGFVGRAWSIVFARAGHDTVMYGPVDGAAQSARETIAEDLPDLSDPVFSAGVHWKKSRHGSRSQALSTKHSKALSTFRRVHPSESTSNGYSSPISTASPHRKRYSPARPQEYLPRS
jgi:hypothetical protein